MVLRTETDTENRLHEVNAISRWKMAKQSVRNVDIKDIQDSMETVKDWFLNKCSVKSNNSEVTSRLKIQNVVTPDSIPQFTIPGQNDCAKQTVEVALSDASSGISSPTSQVSSLQPSPRHVRSAPVSPSGFSKKKMDFVIHSESLDGISEKDTTNADPQSMLATSLPHFRIKTPFGLTTVSQNPHTRRKESLFHASESTSEPQSRTGSFRKNGNSLVGRPQSFNSYDMRNKSRRSTSALRQRRRDVNFVATPLGVMGSSSSLEAQSTEDSPFISEPSTPELSPRIGQRSLLNSSQRIAHRDSSYFRRRSSLALARSSAECTVCNKSSSAGDDSSDEITFKSSRKSPKRRRSSETSANSAVLADPSGPVCHSCVFSRLEARLTAELGELKFSVQYFPAEEELKVLLIKAENLGGRMKADDDISTFAKVSILPEKTQKRVSKVVKHTCDPVYDELMYFQDISPETIEDVTIRIKIMQKGHNLKSDKVIGEVNVDLAAIDLSKENRMWRNLQPKVETEDVGKLDIAVCFEPKEERLRITVNHAKRLLRHPITGGAPDTYIKITVRQPGRPDVKKSTGIRRNVLNPVFKESFIFSISPKIEDLNYTAVTLTLYNHAKLRSDGAMGQVRLGYGSTEESEFEHWNQVLQKPGQELTWQHTLMEPERQQ